METCATLYKPKASTERELKRAGVTIEDRSQTKFSCDACGKVWWAMLRRGGKLPRGYWKCPNGCNDPDNQ